MFNWFCSLLSLHAAIRRCMPLEKKGMVQSWVTPYCHSRMFWAGIQPNAPMDSRQKHAGMTPRTSVTRSKMFLNHAQRILEAAVKTIWTDTGRTLS